MLSPPDGSLDIVARSIAQPLSQALKQSVIVENKAGANGNLGADCVATSAPNGYTLLLSDTGELTTCRSAYTKQPFDPASNLKQRMALSKTTALNFAVTAVGSAPR